MKEKVLVTIGTLAEWLRRQIRNLLGSARVSSNLTGVVPSWLSWQSVRLLTDRSLVRSQAGEFFFHYIFFNKKTFLKQPNFSFAQINFKNT